MKLLSLACGVLVSVLPSFVHACKPQTGSNPIVSGETTYVCLTFNDQRRLPFLVEIDKMTSIGIGGSYDSDLTLTDDSGDWSTFDVSAAGGGDSVAKSLRKIYKYDSGDGKRVMNVYTAIVHVNMGEVTGVSWDEGCFFCAVDTCDASTALQTINANTTEVTGYEQLKQSNTAFASLYGENCYTDVGASGGCAQTCSPGKPCACDLTVYVVWTGTDANGKYMKSAGLRFSRFESFSLNTLYASAKSRTTNYLTEQGLA